MPTNTRFCIDEHISKKRMSVNVKKRTKKTVKISSENFSLSANLWKLVRVFMSSVFVDVSGKVFVPERAAQAGGDSHLISRTSEREVLANFAACFSSSVGALKFVWRSALDLRVLSFGSLGLLELNLESFFLCFRSSSESESESSVDPKPNQLRQKDFSSLCTSSLRLRSLGDEEGSLWSCTVTVDACAMLER